jgi:hypothetical protein
MLLVVSRHVILDEQNMGFQTRQDTLELFKGML